MSYYDIFEVVGEKLRKKVKSLVQIRIKALFVKEGMPYKSWSFLFVEPLLNMNLV